MTTKKGAPRAPVMTAPEVETFLNDVFPAVRGKFEVLEIEAHFARVRCRIDERDIRPGGTVSGVVLDETGEPISDSWVMHRAELGQSVLGMDLGTVQGIDILSLSIKHRGVQADEDGRFTLGGFEPGEHAFLIAAADGYDPARIDDVPAGTTDVEFRLLRAGEDWKLFDLTVDGLSFARSLRAELSPVLSDGGIRALRRYLDEHQR